MTTTDGTVRSDALRITTERTGAVEPQWQWRARWYECGRLRYSALGATEQQSIERLKQLVSVEEATNG